MAFQVKNPHKIIEGLKKKNLPFVLEQTMFSKKIIFEGGIFRWNAKTNLTGAELNFIKQVKEYVNKNPPSISIDRSKILYLKQGKIKNGALSKELFEIDLKSAYWELAYKFKYISTELYLKGLDVRKKVRLMALGNLAKNTMIFEYNGIEFEKPTRRNSVLTENVFFKVSFETDLIMKNLIMLSGNNFLFYWVDAIFIKSEKTKSNLIEYLKDNKINFKVIKLNKLIKKKNELFAYDDTHKTINNPEGKRKFIFQKEINSKKKKYINQLIN